MADPSNEIVLTTKLVGKIQGDFVIPSYQRGYRWGEDEIVRLLDDVYENGENDYCLQPIVIKRDDMSYEVIDGQQRLTTLYLIFSYLKSINPFFEPPAFCLDYRIRERSAEYLKNIDLSLRENNIDFWFIANASETIRSWFEQNDLQKRAMSIYRSLKEKVKVIWYEVGDDEDPIALFTRLNIGKIPLTSSELIKAVFLAQAARDKLGKVNQEEISMLWDAMEKEFHDDSLWYFLTNHSDQRIETRIDLVLDLIADKPMNTREKYFTFFAFNDLCRKEENFDGIWMQIQQVFHTLKEWHEDHELHHKVGYLIASDSLPLQDVYRMSVDKPKDNFKRQLDEAIRESIAIDENYGTLRYDYDSDYRKISRLLLLFNVESVRRNGEHTQWFPFDKFKCSNNAKVTWSLEHIHAQQSVGLHTQEAWREWIRLHIPSVESLDDDHTELLEEMKHALEQATLSSNMFYAIEEQVVELLSEDSGESMHSIGNLALLTSADNAALNNAAFDVKRNHIIEMDKKGQYIPFCTKMVFLKYYTPSSGNQLHFWGPTDRIAYIKHINEVLVDYLPESIDIENERA